MLVAEPAMLTLSRDVYLMNLTGFRKCAVLVESLPDELKDSLTVKDIEGWAANRLTNIGVSVVSREEKLKALKAADLSTDEKALAANDQFFSYVYVNVNAGRTPTGAIYANITLACKRGVFVHPGYFTSATVWDKGTLIYFGSNYDAKDQVRESLNKLLDKLESDWKKCNK